MAATQTKKRTTQKRTTKARKSTTAAKPASKPTKATKPKAADKASEAVTDAQKARADRWRIAVRAGQALQPRQRDENGLSNKDILYRSFIDHLVATGEAMSVQQMKDVVPAYSPSKYSYWRNAWQAYFNGDQTFARRVPTKSRDYRPTKAAARKALKASA